VVKVIAPVRALELSRVMALSSTFVVKLEVPFTVTVPVCVMVPPVAAIRVPCMSDSPKIRFVVPLLMLTFAVVPSCKVVNETAPVKILVAVDKVMALSMTFVVKLEAPVTVNAAVWVMASPEVTVRIPFTVWPARAMAAVVVRVRLPLVVKAARLIVVEPLFKVMCARFVPAV